MSPDEIERMCQDHEDRLSQVERRVRRLPSIAISLAVVVLCLCLALLILGGRADRAQGAEAPALANPHSAIRNLQSVWRVTAYCPCAKCCGPRASGVTASGLPARGRLCAAPPEIPFGRVLVIPGYGRAVVADRGSAIRGRRLDVLFPTHAEALRWGVQYLAVYEQKVTK